MDSIREKINQQVFLLLQQITVANGYQTDMGVNSFRARRSFDGKVLPGLAYWPGRESSSRLSGATNQAMTIEIDGHHLRISNETVDVTAEKMLADILKVMGSHSPALYALIDGLRYVSSDPSYPDDGGESVSINVQFEIAYTTVRGDPYTQS